MSSDLMLGKKKQGNTPDRTDSRVFLRVQFRIILFLLACMFLTADVAQAQQAPRRTGSRVIDDTTRQVYGPNTSTYFYERDVFMNRPVLHSIDTFIHNFHRNANYVQKNNNLYQDLGNIGTAIHPIYSGAPAEIGATTGYHAYDLYWDAEEVKYYDTKSPYTNMELILGGQGRSITRATFSRNINPRWNFGFNFRGIFADKQVQRRGKNDRTTRSNYYDAYTSYENKDSTYQLFMNFRRMLHRVNEFGGVRIDADALESIDDYFDENARPWLTTASSEDLRTNFHLFHQYKIGSGLQFYHTLDRYKQQNKFLDMASESIDSLFFGLTNPAASDSVRDAAVIRTVRNEVGFKGNLLKLFYNGYYAIRHYHMRYERMPGGAPSLSRYPDEKGDEHYFGGRVSLALDSLVELTGRAEIIIPDGNFRIEGFLKSKWLSASLKHFLYKPSFLSQSYRGRHDFWDHWLAPLEGLKNIETSQLDGFLHYRSNVFSISPGITLTRHRNYVFFDKISDAPSTQMVVPVQSGGNQILAAPEVRWSLTFFRHLTLSNRSIYTLFLENNDDAIRVPDLFVNAQLAYSNIFFNGNLDMHAGVDLHRKSAYFAPGYAPAIQQFYNQDVFESPAFPLVDVFVNAKIKRARVFFKYNNVIQLVTGSGYFPTPYYPGQRPIFDFGFDWSFYD